MTRLLPVLLACLLAHPAVAGSLEPRDPVAAPDFSLPAPDGRRWGLAEQRGRVVLVSFWASWCPPCVAELPGMQRLAQRLGGESFAVLAVNVGESAFRIEQFRRLVRVDLPMPMDRDGETFRRWGGSVYPTSWLLDRDGRIRYVVQGPLEWDGGEAAAVIADLLSEPRPTRK